MQAACRGGSRPPNRPLWRVYLQGHEGAGGYWVVSGSVANKNVRSGGLESAGGTGRLWRWRGMIRWDFWRHSIAEVSARTLYGPCAAW